MEHKLGPLAPLMTSSHYFHIDEQPCGAHRRTNRIPCSNHISVPPVAEPINLIAYASPVGIRARLLREQSPRAYPQSEFRCHPSLGVPLPRLWWIQSPCPWP